MAFQKSARNRQKAVNVVVCIIVLVALFIACFFAMKYFKNSEKENMPQEIRSRFYISFLDGDSVKSVGYKIIDDRNSEVLKTDISIEGAMTEISLPEMESNSTYTLYYDGESDFYNGFFTLTKDMEGDEISIHMDRIAKINAIPGRDRLSYGSNENVIRIYTTEGVWRAKLVCADYSFNIAYFDIVDLYPAPSAESGFLKCWYMDRELNEDSPNYYFKARYNTGELGEYDYIRIQLFDYDYDFGTKDIVLSENGRDVGGRNPEVNLKII